MAEIKGGNAKKKISEEFYISEAEAAPVVANIVTPVFDVNKEVSTIVKYSTASSTVYTTPSDKDFYLTAASISHCSTTVGTSYTQIVITQENGAAGIILACNGIVDATISSVNVNNSLSLSSPLKLKRGTNVTMTTVNSDSRFASIVGYTKESQIKQ